MPADPNATLSQDVIAQHGLSPDEFERLLSALGRPPNMLELGLFSVMWSEHCSYKSSRVHLRILPTSGPRVLVGPGENAGIVDIGGGLAVVFKMESHNHPSFIEPKQGAATGVGGILRDVFTMGARPIASLNLLRFGAAQHPRTAFLLGGVVDGIGSYGNSVGVPTVGGEVAFDPSFDGNCLVNAFTVGVLRTDRIFRAGAGGIGNPVFYAGARTGRDGIHGATMASAEFGEDSQHKRPTVQVGDPFTEKRLLEACLELMASDVLVGIQDMGAAGLTSSSVEMAGRAKRGLRLDLERVPAREPGMTPYELMLSELQERMLLVAHRGRGEDVRQVFEKWDLEVAQIGEVTDTQRLELFYHGERVADVPIEPLTDGAPRYQRLWEPPADLEQRWKFDVQSLPKQDVPEVLKELLARPNLASKEWIYRQYDHQVQGATVVLPGGDASVIRIQEGHKGIALSVGCNSRFCELDPFEGARLAVAEACRNLAVVGAEPIGISDCLNFGNPERPEIMWQLVKAIQGLSDVCRALDVPIVSGNVSLYNETEGRAIQPTPAVAAVGLISDVRAVVRSWFLREGDSVALLGTNTGEIGGSELLAARGHTAGRPPRLNPTRERAVQAACRALIQARLIHSAHDCSDGGLAVAIAESCILGPQLLGAKVRLPAITDRPDLDVFSEEPSRIVISFSPDFAAEVRTLVRTFGAAFTLLGTVGGDALELVGLGTAPIEELASAYRTGFATALGLTG